ncbi:MAG: hypothetical protein ABI662_07045 [Dermatophilaceae bacterium]
MPALLRRALGLVVVVLGAALAVFGVSNSIRLGPSGEARLSVTAKTPGSLVVGDGVLNSVDVPVRITATRSDGGTVRLMVAPSLDARAVLAGSAVSTVSAAHYASGTMDLRTSGSGALGDVSSADVWRLSAKGAGSAELVVNQGSGPETAMVTSGDASALRNVRMTLTWADQAWFFEALALAVIGAIIAAFALGDLWHTRPHDAGPMQPGPRHGT